MLISCIAFDRHVYDETIKNNTEVVVYFATGLDTMVNADGRPTGIYLFNEAVVVKCSNDAPRVWKHDLVDFV